MKIIILQLLLLITVFQQDKSKLIAWHLFRKERNKCNGMKKLFVIAIFLNGMFGIAQDGSYKTAIGIRAGETSGLTIKQFIGSSTALEGIIGMWSHGFSTTLLFEKYVPTGSVAGLNLYYGAGGHLAFETVDYGWYYRHERFYRYRHDHFGIGIDGIVGLEYKIPSIPIAFSLDLKPFIEFQTHGVAWVSLDPGLGVKVAL